MTKPFSFNYFGSKIQANSLGAGFLPPLKQTLTAHCIPFTPDGNIVAINIIGRGIDIPGGHIEDGESAIDAMTRETQEEASVTIAHPELVDVWHLTSTNAKLGLTERPYIVMYVADVIFMDNFQPNDEASERLILSPDDFITQYFAGEMQAALLIDRALEMREAKSRPSENS